MRAPMMKPAEARFCMKVMKGYLLGGGSAGQRRFRGCLMKSWISDQSKKQIRLLEKLKGEKKSELRQRKKKQSAAREARVEKRVEVKTASGLSFGGVEIVEIGASKFKSKPPEWQSPSSSFSESESSAASTTSSSDSEAASDDPDPESDDFDEVVVEARHEDRELAVKAHTRFLKDALRKNQRCLQQAEDAAGQRRAEMALVQQRNSRCAGNQAREEVKTLTSSGFSSAQEPFVDQLFVKEQVQVCKRLADKAGVSLFKSANFKAVCDHTSTLKGNPLINEKTSALYEECE
jgi:hypothetical protein